MLAKQITSMIGRLPTPGKGWSEIIYYDMKTIDLSPLNLLEMDHQQIKTTNGGLMLYQMKFINWVKIMGNGREQWDLMA